MAIRRLALASALALCVAVTVDAGPTIGQALPKRVIEAGALVVGIETTYPPMAYKDPKTNERAGLNVDLVTALAKDLGIPLKWEEMAFEQFAPALATGRIDMIGTALADLPSRRDRMTFVDYFLTGSQVFTRAANADAIKTPLDLCGRNVGMPRTTSYLPIMTRWSEQNCPAAGKPLVQISGTAGAAATRLDLKQGRIDAAILGPEYVAFVMGEEPGQYVRVGDQLTRAYFGLAFNKGDEALRDAVAASLGRLMANGTYRAILEKHGLARQALDKVEIDAGP